MRDLSGRGTVHSVPRNETSRPEMSTAALESSGRGTARAEDAQGTASQSHISRSMLVYEEKMADMYRAEAERRGNTLIGLKDFRTENDSDQG